EIVNPGHEFGYRPFPEVQMEAVAMLCKEILARHAIPARNIVGHSDVAPARKEDPGELFDWRRLAGREIGLWPVADAQRSAVNALSDYGYDISNLPKAIIAFQRHFRPRLLNGQWDDECAGLLASLLAML
ncbi:MAG: N-acetylmuramoyl-L-alanine amidase, partial [Pseudomonadota bacterium]|nr:N-acetylmuramoyl-L-alanine amidase [Pseudomonadota bacterium]